MTNRIIIVACFLMSACAAPGTISAPSTTSAITTPAPEKEPPVSLSQITRNDLTKAVALADQAGDKIASQCYTYLLGNLDNLPGKESLLPNGVFSAFQIARNGVKKFSGGPSADFQIACAPLYMDAKGDVIGIAALVARIAGGGALKGLSGGILP